MNNDFSFLAEAIVFAHGNRAESEAARHALLCERMGDMETAETWRTVQSVVRRLTPDAKTVVARRAA
ncbi:hypothetical protein [Aestuariivirga sp.]|uniref:hypothetical protein n=1 Tax=Aestuariivirga sp. TaxID=2650926 RepID=UPI003782E546